MFFRLIGILGVFLILSGCGFETIEDLANTSVAQTRTARPSKPERTQEYFQETMISTPDVEASTVISDTPVPSTSTATLTSTPDVRVIDEDPVVFLLDKVDLPTEANYYIPSSNWVSAQRNYEVIYELGEELGSEYIDRTGRLDGWWVTYKRGASRALAPEEIYHNIVKYKTPRGAKLTVEEYNLGTKDERYEYLDLGQDLGDLSVVMVIEETEVSGKHQVTYRIETAYRNFVSVIMMVGQEEAVDYSFVESIAWKIIDKLKEAPLTETISTE